MLYEVHLGIAGLVEGGWRIEVVIGFDGDDLATAALHALEEQEIARDVLMDEVESEQGMTQVIQDAHEDDEIEFFAESGNVPNGKTAKLDVDAFHFGGEPGLAEVVLVGIDAEDTRGTAALHLQRVEACVATDVEDGFAGEICRKSIAEACELNFRIIAEEMMRRGLDAAEAQIMEPGAERFNLLLESVFLNCDLR